MSSTNHFPLHMPLVLLCAGLSITPATQAVEKQKHRLAVDLTSANHRPGPPQRVFVGSVRKGKGSSRDIAICHMPSKKPAAEQQSSEQQPALVAYIEEQVDGGFRIITPKGMCLDGDCKSIALRLDDANVTYSLKAPSLPCNDTYGILKQIDMKERQEVQLLDLEYQFEEDITIEMSYAENAGATGLDLSGQGSQLRCEIPDDHQHIRFGLGWHITSSPHTSRDLYETDNGLYVCSAGVLVCMINEAYMNDPDNSVVLVANDLDNTIMTAGTPQVDQPRFCNRIVYGSGEELELGLYKIDGWSPEWQAELRIFGQGGHDWIIGGLTQDVIYGGSGNDLLLGGDAGPNYLFGEEGRDVMHGGQSGICNGGSPSEDLECAGVGDISTRWWPHPADDAGDCCCASCSNSEDCLKSDAVPGSDIDVDVPPTPW